MANEYLIHKWRLWFDALDVKKDGVLSREDVTEEEDKFAHLHHFGAEKRKDIIGKLDKWWDQYIFRGKSGPITVQEYIDMQNNDFKEDKEKYTKWAEECAKTIFDILDIEHDGTITQEEFLIAFRSAGHENVKLDKDFFNAYDPKDGKVTVKKMVDTWVTFLTSEDSSQPNIIKDAFEGGL
ncbi:sarcoplasmic calcium-binding protein-like [Mercenaria mercenaria]|uniref:sarcoplasmic calcium-binding protein-like n=1 Tax=Mercenaria mercenaria TaxID=6596 RepID=UPI00234E51C3|nr:sarcoplasmic calcium-binding protein-like [Mercenaria mercenaria]